MYTCAIIDDEPLARKIISDYLAEIDDFEVVFNSGKPVEGLSFIQQNQIDILFLDINMPKLSGIKLASLIPGDTQIVFTTAYPEYAVEAFEVQAIDYLVKPISIGRFLQTLQRIRSSQSLQKSSTEKDVLMIKEDRRMYRIEQSDIYYLKAFGDYVRIFTTVKTYITKDRLSRLEEELGPSFFKVHRSYVINLEWIEYIEGNHVVVYGEMIPISEGNKKSLLDKIN
jgi:DNA-binding LytR/AlgR family response regulator